MQPTSLQVSAFADLPPRTLYDLLRLRVDTFVVEQECPYPELDGRDVEPDARHLWISRDGAVLACLRVLYEPDGTARIGRVAVAPAERGGGHGARLMTEALALVGAAPCVLSAQSHQAGFYARFGFTADGPEYDEDGIPHVPMRRPGRPAR
ncbi:GNAT family N-acetyltransferase [Micromonospora sp. NPDC000207]|uniref:GNAT family N-acetyltransferase n=1 Tax=Micromonospora sp. NPDC000207 TaxID=3154246 RepID=UPI003322BA26